ncbi:hypothetical protein JCM8097_000313 [Rhodosporidiobolus ruineniae]
MSATPSDEAKSVANDEALALGENLKGRVVVVAGASKGLGRDFALKAASFGAILVLGARNIKACEELASQITQDGGKALAIQLDVTNWDSQKKAVGFVGYFDVVMANAGVIDPPVQLLDHPTGPDGELLPPSLASIETNVIGTVYTTKLAHYHFRASPSPDAAAPRSLVICGSMGGFYGPTGMPLYLASKFALRGLLMALMEESQEQADAVKGYLPPGKAANDNIDFSYLAAGPTPETGIFGAASVDQLMQFPHCKMVDVVDAMVGAAGTKGRSGTVWAVDDKGTFTIPHMKTLPPFEG